MDGAHIAKFLRSIPRSDEDAIPLGGLVNEDEVAICAGIALMLKLWGCVHYDESSLSIQASSQTARYTLHSLASYAERSEVIIDDWKERGVQSRYDAIFQNGASFLYALEHQRLRRDAKALPSRYERVAQVLITRHTAQNDVEYLMQYDHNAGQYQFIGGRAKESDSDILETMTREIEEEITPVLTLGRDYELVLLVDHLELTPSLSPTFGALTAYTFTIYHMRGLRVPLSLGVDDRWIPVEQIKRGGVVVDGVQYSFNNRALYETLDQQLTGGLAQMSSSLT